jgi:hypothetical protein
LALDARDEHRGCVGTPLGEVDDVRRHCAEPSSPWTAARAGSGRHLPPSQPTPTSTIAFAGLYSFRYGIAVVPDCGATPVRLATLRENG